MLTVGLVALLLGITEGLTWGWSSAGVLGLFGLAAVVLLGFVGVERRAAVPLIAPLEWRLGSRVPLVAGLMLAAGGSVLLAVWHGEVAQVVLCYLVCSVGYGFAMCTGPSR